MTDRILILDIETSPHLAWSWGPMWEAGLIEIVQPLKIISFSAKWFGGKHITKGLPDYKGYKKGVVDDYAITKELWELLNEADIIVAHNGNRFDLTNINTRLAAHGFTPPSPYKSIDTKVEYKRYFRMPSNKLDEIGNYFGLGRKLEHEGWPLWKGCMAGDKKCWKKMLIYNKQDVTLLEKVYLMIRPWIKHPNLGMYRGKTCCPNCGSDSLQARGYAIKGEGRYRRVQCSACGHWSAIKGNLAEVKPLVHA